MEGKIVVYSSETGVGRIMTPDRHKFRFTIDAWDDYDEMPAIGMEVQFRPEGEEALDITPSKEKNTFQYNKTDNMIIDGITPVHSICPATGTHKTQQQPQQQHTSGNQ